MLVLCFYENFCAYTNLKENIIHFATHLFSLKPTSQPRICRLKYKFSESFTYQNGV